MVVETPLRKKIMMFGTLQAQSDKGLKQEVVAGVRNHLVKQVMLDKEEVCLVIRTTRVVEAII